MEAFLAAALKLAPLAVEAGANIASIVGPAIAAYERGSVTDADWQALHDAEGELRAKLG
jgi:hypothetical protein